VLDTLVTNTIREYGRHFGHPRAVDTARGHGKCVYGVLRLTMNQYDHHVSSMPAAPITRTGVLPVDLSCFQTAICDELSIHRVK